MAQIVRLTDQHDLVPTSEYPYATWDFPTLNCVQSRVHEIYNEDANALIAAATSAGKTVVAELYLAHEVRKRGGKGLFLAPLKALAQEKIDDWTDSNYHFKDLNVSVCTGDYRITPVRREELKKADILILTSEMLNSRGRNFKSENNDWLSEVGTVVVDESHLLTVPGRGDHLEAGLMKYTEIAPNGRVVCLSATLPNVDEIGGWLSALNGKPTYLLESKYRPCPLTVHYKAYESGEYTTYQDGEKAKMMVAINHVREHPADKFLLFVHSKKTGQLLLEQLKERGVKAEYHYSVLDKKERLSIEKRFREDKDLRVVVATSGLAWGVNMPARRVCVLGPYRGISEQVKNYDLWQMFGRAGRPRYDPAGDAYMLLPRKKLNDLRKQIETPEPITSQMGYENVLAFHIVSEIHHGGIKTREGVRKWYSRSLAAFQKHDLGGAADVAIQRLLDCKAIKEENGELKITPIGVVSSLFYYNPPDVKALYDNFSKLFKGYHHTEDTRVAMALANIGANYTNAVSADEKHQSVRFSKSLDFELKNALCGGKQPNDGVLRAAHCFHMLMNGENSTILSATLRNLQMDFDRTGEVLAALDSMAGKWGQGEWLKQLKQRIKYGVSEELIDLVALKGIGKVKAQRLFDARLFGPKEIANPANRELLMRALRIGDKAADEIIADAKSLLGKP